MPTYLDPEIANEGEAATMWHPGAGPAPIPDMQKMLGNHKHYGRYFAPYIFRPFPSDIYHATEPKKTVKNAKEANEYGVSYVTDENGANGHYLTTGEWKTYPVGKQKPNTSGAGKNVVSAERAQGGASLEVMTQILQQMQKGQSNDATTQMLAEILARLVPAAPSVPPAIEPKPMEFLVTEGPSPLSDNEVKSKLIELAKENNIHVDKRWSLERIKAALDDVDDAA